MATEIDKIARRGQNTLGAARHFGPGYRQGELAAPALNQFDADLAFKLLDLHR